MDNMRTLNTSLPSSTNASSQQQQPQQQRYASSSSSSTTQQPPPNQHDHSSRRRDLDNSGNAYPPASLHEAFKSAAVSVAQLYKTAIRTVGEEEQEVRSAGYQDAIDDLLEFLDRENLGLEDGEGWKVRRWATERVQPGMFVGAQDEVEQGQGQEQRNDNVSQTEERRIENRSEGQPREDEQEDAMQEDAPTTETLLEPQAQSHTGEQQEQEQEPSNEQPPEIQSTIPSNPPISPQTTQPPMFHFSYNPPSNNENPFQTQPQSRRQQQQPNRRRLRKVSPSAIRQTAGWKRKWSPKYDEYFDLGEFEKELGDRKRGRFS